MGFKPKALREETPAPVATPEPVAAVDTTEEYIDEFAHLNGKAPGLVPAASAAPASPLEALIPGLGAGIDPTATFTMADFAKMLGAAVAQGVAQAMPAQPAQRMTFGQYMKRLNAGRPKMRRPYFENGIHQEGLVLSNTEIDLLNQITRTGRYINRLVEVIVRQEGADEILEMRWNTKRDAIFELKGYARNFEDICRQVVEAQKAEQEADDAREDRAHARRALARA
jgi:hypothetical protein